MRHALFALLVIVPVTARVSTPLWAQEPGFDCNAASSPSQVAICTNRALGRLDRDQAAAFARGLAAADSGTQVRMQRDQVLWQRFRDLCGDDRTCLTNRYAARIGELTAVLNPAAAPPATVPQVTGESALRRIARNRRVPELSELLAIGEAIHNGDLAPRDPDAPPSQAAQPAATVQPDGTIEKPMSDGRIAFYNPATDARGYINPDGTRVSFQMLQVQTAEPPPLPPDYSSWSSSVSESLSGLVRSLLTPTEAETLASRAPEGFFARLEYDLRILAFITG